MCVANSQEKRSKGKTLKEFPFVSVSETKGRDFMLRCFFSSQQNAQQGCYDRDQKMIAIPIPIKILAIAARSRSFLKTVIVIGIEC